MRPKTAASSCGVAARVRALRERVDHRLDRVERDLVAHRPERDAEDEVGIGVVAREVVQERRPTSSAASSSGRGADAAVLAVDGLEHVEVARAASTRRASRRRVAEARDQLARGDLAFVAELDRSGWSWIPVKRRF